jgi:transposase
VLDLLPDRDAETLATWLRAYPTIQVVARDRSLQYAQGITQGAPQAIQVADRWHLLKNLTEMLERAFRERLPKLKKRMRVSAYSAAPREKFPRSTHDQEKQRDVRAQRLRDYTLIQFLRQKGYSERRIARLLKMSRGKVRFYAAAQSFPERKTHYVPSRLDPFLPYLEQRFQAGVTNARQAWREIRDRGYPGTSGQVSKWMRQRRKATLAQQSDVQPTLSVSLPDLRTCLHLFTLPPARLATAEKFLLEQLLTVDTLRELYDVAQNFVRMICERQASVLDNWLRRCASSDLESLKSFAASLQPDSTAVRRALELPWSNGQTEGQVNRLKMLKRQMYGRANLDLLRLRVLYSPCLHIT